MSNECAHLHAWCGKLPLHSFPYVVEKIPLNGIYVLFEKGEIGHEGNRIVRVGTHTGKNQLRSRLWQHFLNENKDRSIFRKNIGRCFLNREGDAYLEKWEWDLTTKAAKEKYRALIDMEKQLQLEKQISNYLQSNFYFAVFEVNDAVKRLEWESKFLSTIAKCEECVPSKEWLGNYSPIAKIREFGLWNVQGIDGKILTKKDFVEYELSD